MNTPNITFEINYDDEGGATVIIFENGEEHSSHRVRANVASQWACQEVACIRERRAEEAAWLAETR